MIHWITIFLLFSLSLGPGTGLISPRLQGAIDVEDLGVTYEFNNKVTFNARIRSGQEIKEVLLFVTPAGEQAIMRPVSFDPAGEVHYSIPSGQLDLRPFTTNHFHFVIGLASGEILPSRMFDFRYEDHRFQWQSLLYPDFEVWWYGRDAAFGQALLNVARDGLKAASEILVVDPPTPIRIYAYDSSTDMQSALNLSQSWIVGHAAPDLGQMYIYIPKGPEQTMEIERQVPHEIMHFLQYQVAGSSMRNQPVWLMEGMASLAELYPNAEYQRVLSTTAQRRELLSMTSLCPSFPRNASGAFQAYAQSASFVRFLYQEYGNTGLRSLMEQYNTGQGCEQGIVSALGVSLAQVEYRWKQQSLGIDAGNLVLRNLAPYLMIVFLVAFPIVLTFIPYRRENKTAPKEQQVLQKS